MAAKHPHNTGLSCFRIGSQAVQLHGLLPPVLNGLTRIPLDPDGGPGVELGVEVVDSCTWELGMAGGGHSWRKCLPDHAIEIDFLSRRLSLHVVAGELSRRARYFLFRDVFCFLGSLSGDMLAHASGIVHDGEAILFCARAGGGKSTTASMFAGCCDVINDEINWVHGAGRDRLAVVNQPFWQQSGQPAEVPAVPLRAIYLLEKAEECSLEPVCVPDAFPVLLAAPFGGRDPVLRARSEATAQCARIVPLRRLRFTLDAGAVRDLVLGDAGP